MPEEEYIWCRDCDEIHHVTSLDGSPIHSVEHGEGSGVSQDDWHAFKGRHGDHKIEGLKGSGSEWISEGRTMDPMGVRYIEVTNKREWFVIRSSQKSVEDPLNFKLIPGRLKATQATVDIQENKIVKEVKLHFPWKPSERLRDVKIELFIRLFKEFVSDLDPNEIDTQETSLTDTSVVYGLLNTDIVERLVSKCRPYFISAELKGIRRFCLVQLGKEGVLALLIRRQYRIEASV